jgi:two-component system LytT family response regulator
MLTAVVIEDEPRTRDTIIGIVKSNCPEIKVVGSGNNVKSGIEAIHTNRPDILVLDVELSDGNAFDILKNVGEINAQIIFVTAHEEYALQAIKFSAFDYLLKPFSVAELTETLIKAKEAAMKKESELSFKTLLSNFENKEDKKIVLKSADEIHLVKISDIIRCEADSSYTHFFITNNKQIVISNNLKEYDELLSHYHFFRVHHSHLVNLNQIVKFHKNKDPYVLMSDGSEVPVSSRKKERLIEKFSTL